MGLGEAPLGPHEDFEVEAGNVDLRVRSTEVVTAVRGEPGRPGRASERRGKVHRSTRVGNRQREDMAKARMTISMPLGSM